MSIFSKRKKRKAIAEATDLIEQVRANRARQDFIPDNTASVALFTALHPGAFIDPDEQQREADKAYDGKPEPTEEPAKPDDTPVVSERYSYEAPEYSSPVTEVYQPSWSSSSDSGSSDSGSSYSDGGSY